MDGMTKLHTPMCDLLAARAPERSTLNEFLEFLQERGIKLCLIPKSEEDRIEPRWAPASQIDRLVLGFLEVNPEELERERQGLVQMVQQIASVRR